MYHGELVHGLWQSLVDGAHNPSFTVVETAGIFPLSGTVCVFSKDRRAFFVIYWMQD